MPNVSEILREATEILRENGVAEPRREAASLLAFTLSKDKTFLISHDDYELSREEQKKIRDFLNRRANREPFQYITGFQEFYGLDFFVAPGVLIPRPETELIVENAIKILSELENSRFCEIGIGSGCISISILHEVKNSTAIGLDVSPKALEITQKNAVKHKVADRLQTKISDVFAVFEAEKFDLIVSNPPYIAVEDISTLQREVRDYEPLVALTDGGNGLSIVEKIVRNSPNFLKPGGFLLMEIGFDQARKVSEMFDSEKWQSLEILQDLQGIPRTVMVQNKIEA
ncbi:MAG TPA: peptide chain release factor N(5)-glutamine methyltransferase [Pyrinomonadaceae bacterium]|jgi:release factor glutamine methyltransferase